MLSSTKGDKMEQKRIYTIEEIRAELKKRSILTIARSLGIGQTTLYQISRGEHTNITYDNYVALVQHLFGVSIE